MYWSKLFIPTLRDDPAEAEVASHKLLLRAGYIRQLSAGTYNYLLLAQRSLNKIQRIIREEMDKIGGQEMFLPALHPAEVWQESGRWSAIGHDMFRLKDRFGRDLCLGMTHEEVMTFVARGELRSYKQLPQIWYQIQTKFRDEPRPKSGLLRLRQFIMKDSYSFDLAPAGLDESFDKHREAYKRIFTRCGLEFFIVEAHSGAMGGSQSNEFMVLSDAGEDFVVYNREVDYWANMEKAVSRPIPPAAPDFEGELEPEPVHTPGKKTIDEVSAFLEMPATSLIKSVVQVVDGKPVLALLRGDHQLSETKFGAVCPGEARPAHPAEIRDWFGADPGSLGPVGVKTKMRVVADEALRGRRNMVTGANRDDYHLRNVTLDANTEFADIRQVNPGDTELVTGLPLSISKAMEVGHIFKLGYKYSKSMGLNVLNESGEETPVIMGSYGIGVERILSAAIELFHDKDGISLPASIAPFDCVITVVNAKDEVMSRLGREIYEAAKYAGLDPLLDDRDERPGVKFKDADLIGIPWRITVGKKAAQGVVEVVERRTKSMTEMPASEAAAYVQSRTA
ncbi:MAG: proline--tRNA ligase [Bryobacteraceae bacterium]|nr:proline--tRNA ligase [Bryobacteraceae bacterium]